MSIKRKQVPLLYNIIRLLKSYFEKFVMMRRKVQDKISYKV